LTRAIIRAWATIILTGTGVTPSNIRRGDKP
jgi:hypothetical protein